MVNRRAHNIAMARPLHRYVHAVRDRGRLATRALGKDPQHMNKTIVIALATTFASLTGCAMETDSDVHSTTQAYSTGQTCNDNTGINPMKAALAVAMASELGRIDPLKDLYFDGSTVVLTSAAKQVCSGRGYGSCNNVEAILGMQNTAVNKYISTGMFNATAFREELKASFNRQTNREVDLAKNQPAKLPQPHELREIGMSNYGACGIHYDYSVTGQKPENLQYRMDFFGGTQNPFIDFRSTDRTISIDPTGTMNGDTNANSGMCTVGCYGYSASLRNTCCSCDKKQGKYLKAPWNSSMVYCAY